MFLNVATLFGGELNTLLPTDNPKSWTRKKRLVPLQISLKFLMIVNCILSFHVRCVLFPLEPKGCSCNCVMGIPPLIKQRVCIVFRK